MMTMKHLEDHVKALEKDNHPAAKLGRFLLSHSNDSRYLVDNLAAFLTSCQKDLAAERDLAQLLHRVKTVGPLKT
jgi:ribosomal protein S15P/S13E